MRDKLTAGSRWKMTTLPPLSPVAVNVVAIVIAAFVLQLPSNRSVPESGMYVTFFSPRIPVLHMLIVLSVRESFLLLRTSLEDPTLIPG